MKTKGVKFAPSWYTQWFLLTTCDGDSWRARSLGRPTDKLHSWRSDTACVLPVFRFRQRLKSSWHHWTMTLQPKAQRLTQWTDSYNVNTKLMLGTVFYSVRQWQCSWDLDSAVTRVFGLDHHGILLSSQCYNVEITHNRHTSSLDDHRLNVRLIKYHKGQGMCQWLISSNKYIY